MDLKRLFTQVVYKIEAKPEGGFIARATDPSVLPLEAPTREELQEKIQQKMLDVISDEFPGLKVPSGAKHTEMSFHIEHNPGGGYSIHSSDPNRPVIETANHKELESQFLEKVLGFAGNNLSPEMVKKLFGTGRVGQRQSGGESKRLISDELRREGHHVRYSERRVLSERSDTHS